MTFYLKIYGAVLVVIAFFLIGFLFSEKLRLRKEYLLVFVDFLTNLSTGIRYDGQDIYSLVEKCGNNKMLGFNFNTNTSFSVSWKDYVNNLPKGYGLTYEDYSLLIDFGFKLGSTDVQGEVTHIDLYKNLIMKQLKKAEKDYAEKSKLYKTLGFFCGALIALFII